MIELRVTQRHHAENDTLNIRQEAYYNVIAYRRHSVSQPFGNMVGHLYIEPQDPEIIKKASDGLDSVRIPLPQRAGILRN